MFKRVLVANRGEIAVRVLRTCREMGIETIAVYSEADRLARHVLEADRAIALGGSPPLESYLDMDRLVNAAKGMGAEAVHPGYGFLAENAAFAERCHEEGLVFIGPPASAIRTLGSKTLARRLMESAGVPVIPGMTEPAKDPDQLVREAERLGYPVLVKAVAGGGGKGMRTVSSPEELREAALSAQSEAEKAFGDGSLYLEKLLQSPRHIEFQILADAQGQAVHLFERECSIQRRHQKIIEETPSPFLTPELREAMGRAAVAAARASGYVNAGTVEFLVDASGAFYFLEVNTRLQVEHPVTEMITGLDLVRKQLEIAAGEPLGLSQEEIRRNGHALECRIYAEDPEAEFFPSPGRILVYREPEGPGIRVDGGVYSGFEVPVDYDPILSKLIVHAETREGACSRMRRALQDFVVLGIRTTIPFLLDVLGSEAYLSGALSTDFVERHCKGWKQPLPLAEEAAMGFVAWALAHPERKRVSPGPGPGAPVSPWETLGNWKM